MAPTEQTILTTFLLAPSPLTAIISLSSFTALFPHAEQSSPELKRLYRALQHARALLTDAVAEDIGLEVKRGDAQRRAVARSRRADEKEDLDEEVVVENALFGSTSGLNVPHPHTLQSILRALDEATQDVSVETHDLEHEAAMLLSDISTTVSGLSDLRYGRLANVNLRDELLQGMNGLEDVCVER